MKLEHLLENIQNDPLKCYLYLERYVDFGSKTYSPFSNQTETDYLYQPTNPIDAFEVSCVLIPKEKVSIYLDRPSDQLFNLYIQGDSVVFPIHPEIFQDERIPYIKELKQYPKGKSLHVSPTASTRSVMLLTEYHHFIKLHYPKRISRFIRRFRENNIRNCIAISQDLQNLAGITYLPETMGMVYGSNKDAWGFIIRESRPRPFENNKRFLIPLFALYSQDINDLNDDPLLIQLINHLSVDPLTFVVDHIMKPIIRNWCSALKERGILLEAHGQNTLLEVDTHLYPKRIVFRDLDVYVDRGIRKERGLHLNFPESHMIDSEKRQAIYSLKYDSFLGHHVFDYISSLLNRFYGIDVGFLQKTCQECFYDYFRNSEYFSDKTFYYSNEILPENKFELVETNEIPKWR